MALFRPSAEIPQWSSFQFGLIQSSTRKLRRLAASAGSNSDQFEASVRKLRAASEHTRNQDIADVLENRVDARALSHLMATDSNFAARVQITDSLAQKIKDIQWPLSKLVLSQLVNVYFFRFGIIDAKSEENLLRLIDGAFSSIQLKGSSGFLNQISSNRHWLLRSTGPADVAARARTSDLNLESYLLSIGLGAALESKFALACRAEYYVRILEQLAVGEDHPVLAEVTRPEIHDATFDQTNLIGHKVLSILIDRSPNGEPSEAWQSTILKIAGDPRVSKSSSRYQKWWQLLGPQRIRKVSSWLSKVDLQMFLDVLESSAKGQADIERMFPPRKKFMEGLLSQGLVINSRLILSRQAVNELEARYRKDQIPEHATKTGTISVIYLELPNDVHLLEGTHSFKIKLVDQMPDNGKIIDYSVTEFQEEYLRSGWLMRYEREPKSNSKSSSLNQTHGGSSSWQTSVINYLRNKGIKVNAADLFTRDQYTVYKNRQGYRY